MENRAHEFLLLFRVVFVEASTGRRDNLPIQGVARLDGNQTGGPCGDAPTTGELEVGRVGRRTHAYNLPQTAGVDDNDTLTHWRRGPYYCPENIRTFTDISGLNEIVSRAHPSNRF